MQDEPLLANLSAGDFIAQGAKYRAPCLTLLYDKARNMVGQQSNGDDMNHGTAFAGLVTYIEHVRMDSLKASVCKLKDLAGSLQVKAGTNWNPVAGRVHSIRLKDGLLSYIPDMETHKHGRHVVLVCNEDIGAALVKACELDADNDGVNMIRATAIGRGEMGNMKLSFDGLFDFHTSHLEQGSIIGIWQP